MTIYFRNFVQEVLRINKFNADEPRSNILIRAFLYESNSSDMTSESCHNDVFFLVSHLILKMNMQTARFTVKYYRNKVRWKKFNDKFNRATKSKNSSKDMKICLFWKCLLHRTRFKKAFRSHIITGDKFIMTLATWADKDK